MASTHLSSFLWLLPHIGSANQTQILLLPSSSFNTVNICSESFLILVQILLRFNWSTEKIYLFFFIALPFSTFSEFPSLKNHSKIVALEILMKLHVFHPIPLTTPYPPPAAPLPSIPAGATGGGTAVSHACLNSFTGQMSMFLHWKSHIREYDPRIV